MGQRTKASPPGQEQMYYAAVERSAAADQTFLALVRSGMTKRDLQLNIKRRPALWSKYSNWLSKLPEQRPDHVKQEVA